MKKLHTAVNEEEYKLIQKICKDRGITPYTFVKEAVIEHLKHRKNGDTFSIDDLKKKIRAGDGEAVIEILKGI